MSAVISGTNGLLQSYDYQVPTTGFSYTFAAGVQTLIMNPAGTLATGTITMPAAPADGMTITFSSSQQITALTMAGNGASLVGAVTFLPAKTGVTYVYRATGTTWFPTATVPGTGSQLVSGTSQATTSGTAVGFTGIPSWAKRITLLLNVVSASGGNNLLVQIGSGSYTTTGYVSTAFYATTTPSTNSVTNGFLIRSDNAGNNIFGAMTLSSFGANLWVETWTGGGTSNNQVYAGGGLVTLSGALDRVQLITTSTDTFDAGSINILYE
jgi:hypothetical protein